MKSEEIRVKLQELQELAASSEDVELHADIGRLRAKLGTEVGDAWQRVEIARHPDRPNALQYIQGMSERYIELHGDRAFGDDPALIGGIATIDGTHFTFLGHQKGHNMKENLKRNYGMAHPEGYRKALRLARQAEQFGRPIVTLIDTPGAFPGLASEERGISEAIASNLRDFSVLRTPIICIVIGEGGSGGALGIGIGDRVFMLENTVYSVISPEGFASIILRDAKRAREAAGLMRMTAADLQSFGIADEILPEPAGGAHAAPDVAIATVRHALLRTYKQLRGKRPEQLIRERGARLLAVGNQTFAQGADTKRRGIKRLFGRSGS